MPQNFPFPLHHRKSQDFSQTYVSSKSRWGDSVWLFDYDVPGIRQNIVKISWRIKLHDGSTLGDSPTHETMLDWLKCFVWSLFTAPGDGKRPLASTSAGALSVGLAAFVSWMVFRGITLPNELDEDVLDDFVEELPSIILGKLYGSEQNDEADPEIRCEPDETISLTQAWIRLRIPLLIWQQRDALSAAGYATMAAEPWGGRRAREIARGIGKCIDQSIPPIPDEVAIPIMNRATWFLGIPSDDILRLRDEVEEAYKSCSYVTARQGAQRKVVQHFRFSVEKGRTEPWRGEIRSVNCGPRGLSNLMIEVRRLVLDVRDASMIVLESTTGMRSSEILGLPSGMDPQSGLPNCITVEKSASGLHEIFLIKASTKKGRAIRTPADWVLGMRPLGSTYIPLPVRALILVEKLFSRDRKAESVKNRLFVTFKTIWGLPRKTSTIRDITNHMFNHGMRNFIERYVDFSNLPSTSEQSLVPDDLLRYKSSKGRCIRSAQWRRTLGIFVYRTDPRLIPALSMQFKHMSIVMTEEKYIGRNALLLEDFKSARIQETAMLMRQLAEGKTALAGRMGEHLEKHASEIRALSEGLPPTKAWLKTIEFVIDHNLLIWFSPHGNCLSLQPNKMRCHEQAGTTSWLNKEPNYALREPALCAGCPCFILDESRSGYWEERYIANMASWKNAEKAGSTKGFEAIRERAYQAKALLKKMAIDTSVLDNRVAQKIAAGAYD